MAWIRGFRAILVGFAVIAALVAFVFWPELDGGNDSATPANPGAGSIALAAPPLQGSTPAFPEDQAGISAYLKVTDSIDLDDVRGVFFSVEQEGPDFLIGTVSVPSSDKDDEYPHLYVDVNGWAIAYMPRGLYSDAALAPWRQSHQNTTTLADAIAAVATELSLLIDLGLIGYYHFEHPEATGFVMAMEAASGTEDFFVTIPSTLQVIAAEWGYRSSHTLGWASLNDDQFVTGHSGSPSAMYGNFGSGVVASGATHKFTANRSSLAFVMIYSE